MGFKPQTHRQATVDLYDKGGWYWNETPEGLPDEARWAVACAHMGHYLKWCFMKGWVGEEHGRESMLRAVEAVKTGDLSGTEFVVEYCDCKLLSVDLDDDGRAFTSYYYTDRYLDDLKTVATQVLFRGPEADYDAAAVSELLDLRYAEWLAQARPRRPANKKSAPVRKRRTEPDSSKCVVRSQKDLDQLVGLKEIAGDLLVYPGTTLTNLDGLRDLSVIGGGCWICDSKKLTTLDGLRSLTKIGDYLKIGGNDALRDIRGLSNLRSVGSDISIDFNDSLASLDGLQQLSAVNNLYIKDNASLVNLKGLDRLTSVGGELEISGQKVLVNLCGVRNVSTVGETLHITENDALVNLNGLEGLESIGGDLIISCNASLVSLDGLQGLGSIGAGLYIFENGVLAKMNALRRLTKIGEDCEINDNPTLSTSELSGLLSRAIEIGGSVATS